MWGEGEHENGGGSEQGAMGSEVSFGAKGWGSGTVETYVDASHFDKEWVGERSLSTSDDSSSLIG